IRTMRIPPGERGQSMAVFEARAAIDVPAAEAFRWHARPGAFLRLTPPWMRVAVIDARGGIETGARLVLRVGTPPLAVPWVAVHPGTEEGHRFFDVQESGPFAHWVHEHRFEAKDPGRSDVVDRVDYTIPFGTAGEIALGAFVRRRLERVFRYRGRITAEDLAR